MERFPPGFIEICVKWDCKYVGERECMASERMVYFWDFLDLSE